MYQLWKSENSPRDRSRLENKTKKRHLILTGYCNYRDVFTTLVYQWREDFVGEDFICITGILILCIVAVVTPNLTMNGFRHSPYWKHRFVMRVQFFKGTVFNHVSLTDYFHH